MLHKKMPVRLIATLFITMSSILSILSCDHVPKRAEGSCLSSPAYGGPFKVKKAGWNLIVTDINKKTEDKKFPNDNSWSNIECPK